MDLDERRRRWVAAIVDKVVKLPAEATQGGRNAALFRAAARLADLPDEGDAPDDRQITNLLTAAADQAGLPKQEAVATIRSGIRSGRRNRKGWPAHLAGKGTRPPRPTASVRPPRPADPSPTRPPADEVAALWRGSLSLDTTADDPGQTFAAAVAWLESRGLNVAAVADEDLARAIPDEGGLPGWAGMGTGRRFQSWRDTKHLLIVQGWSSTGDLESLHARAVLPAEPKAIWPIGVQSRGLVLANGPALAMLRGWPGEEVARVVVAEGVPDFLTWAALWRPADPVLGITAGSWTPEVAARIPDGAQVAIWTDHDPPGDGYATAILESLAGRQVEVTRGIVKGPDGKPAKGPDGKPMDVNDLHRAALLPDDPFEDCEPMELTLEQRQRALAELRAELAAKRAEELAELRARLAGGNHHG